MSVWFHRGAIRRAVAGDLSEPAERRLRAHLHGCQACRAHYDELAGIAEAFAVTRGATGTAAGTARERARLLAALPSPEEQIAGGLDATRLPASRTARARRPTLTWAVAFLVPAAAAALWLVVRPASHPNPPAHPDSGAGSVAWRGSSSGEDPGPPASLLVFASRKGSSKSTSKSTPADAAAAPPHVRLVADLPASGEGRVSRGDFVQFVLRGLQAKAFVTVIGIDDEGEVHTYVPPAGSEVVSHEPSPSSISLGSSVDLGSGHRTGRLRLYALMSPSALDPARIRVAAGRIDLKQTGAPPLDLPVPQVAGVLTIGP